MILDQLSKYIWDLIIAFYRFILKLTINAHQVITHWRIRINRERNNQRDQTPPTTTENLDQQYITNNNKDKLNQLELHRHNSVPVSITTKGSSSLLSKTPNTRRSKLYSLVNRLSLRNFMEYCVIALNEASSSSCSNKFDLNSCEKPVWILGRFYDLPQDVNRLVEDIKSKLWITYRRNFLPIDDNTRYTTDKGFGCMIRCGQMVLANALLSKNLGRDWRWCPNGLESNPEVYVKILKLFQDKEQCLYSIHNIVRVGQQEGKVIGEWFGPNTIAQALKRLSLTAAVQTSNELLISIDTALDNVVVIDEIKAKFKKKSDNDGCVKSETSKTTDDDHIKEHWTPGILFIQLRLGLTKINPLYFAALRKTFQFKNSLGIIGGRPNHALYLIGYTEDDIIYLDPHSTQDYIDLDSSQPLELSSGEDTKQVPIDATYHCSCPEKMSIDRLDPSMALCFCFNSEYEFDEWCRLSNDLLINTEQAPMFEITASRPTVDDSMLNCQIFEWT